MEPVLVRVERDDDVAVCEAMWVEHADWATAEYVARFGDMTEALALYRSFGFVVIEPYAAGETARYGIEAHSVYLELGL